jgi:arabinosyltransferase C
MEGNDPSPPTRLPTYPPTSVRFIWIFSILATVLAFLPAVYALATAPSGASYIGFEYNTDDHMVYAAWMRQAMDGHFLMDNRFTTLPQPGLTIHLYFFVLGLIAKLTGIPLAAAIGRAVFNVLFIHLAARLATRLGFSEFGRKVALGFVVFGAGIGFLVWQTFGVDITNPNPGPLGAILMGHLPIDVWQPEGFVFPSMLTNGLFMVSLCLIVFAFLCFLKARDDKRAVIPGFLAVGVLMNIHSYDVLTVALVMIGLLVAVIARRQATAPWILRCVIIGAGALIPALWFAHVLQSDVVFQARAATETYSPNFRQVLAGYLLMIVLGLGAAFLRANEEPSVKRKQLRIVGVALAGVLFVALAVLAGSQGSGFFLSKSAWICVYLIALAAVGLAADQDPAWNLVFAWAVVGTIAIYFPGLFQRKLTMGLSVPWALLSAFLIQQLIGTAEQSRKVLYTSLAFILICASSIRWLFRDFQFIRLDVSNTTRHPVYLSPDVKSILDYLNHESGRNVLLALPGAGNPATDQSGQPIPDEFQSPALPDLSPICSGLTGVYTYAGHWSETPDYGKCAADMYRFFFNQPFKSVHDVMSAADRADFIARTGANFAILPSPKVFNALPLVDAAQLGDVVVPGDQFELIRLRH